MKKSKSIDNRTLTILHSMIETRLGPVLRRTYEKEEREHQALAGAYEEALKRWEVEASVAMLREAQRMPKAYVYIPSGTDRPVVSLDRAALLDWFIKNHPHSPKPVAPAAWKAPVEVAFAALSEKPWYPYKLRVPVSVAPQLRKLADQIDMTFLSGEVAGLIDALNDTIAVIEENTDGHDQMGSTNAGALQKGV